MGIVSTQYLKTSNKMNWWKKQKRAKERERELEIHFGWCRKALDDFQKGTDCKHVDAIVHTFVNKSLN